MSTEEKFAAACARAQVAGIIAIKTDSDDAQTRALKHLLDAASLLGFSIDVWGDAADDRDLE